MSFAARAKKIAPVLRQALALHQAPQESQGVIYRTVASASPPVQPSQVKAARSGWGWVLLAPAGFAAFLGTWQVNRYRWKVDLLKQREAGLSEDPTEVFGLPKTPEEYSRVAGSGEFQHDKSIYVGPRPRTVMGTANAGYTLVTPMVNSEWNKGVLVNRGWVPAEWRSNPKMRSLGCPTGQVEVVGVVRASEKRSGFVPDNNPKKGDWYWIDVPAMALACGLPPDTPLIEVFESDREYEQRGPTPTSVDVLSFNARTPPQTSRYPLPKPAGELMGVCVTPTNHRNYALTWFSLSGATAFLAMRALRTPGRRR